MADTNAGAQQIHQLSLLPVSIDGPWTAKGYWFGSLLPWNTVSAMALEGHPPSEPKTAELIVAFEWPISYWTLMDGPLTKAAVEKLHLERYCSDRLFAEGQLPYTQLNPGKNPPDFEAELPGSSTLAVDATQLTAADRIAAQAQFERVRAAVLAAPRKDFAHLRGHFLYLGFSGPEDEGRPHQSPESVDSIVAALSEYEPDTSWMERRTPGAPEQLPDTDFQSTSNGCVFYAVELRNAVPASPFFAEAGFELVLAYQSKHRQDAAWHELRRLVDRHDKPEIDHLVVTVGGPKANGLAYPSETLLFEAALAHAIPALLPEPKHLSKVVLHSWVDGRILEIYPSPVIYPPLYKGGYVTPHYAFEAPTTRFAVEADEGA
jgi:hypothetical protein